MMALPDFSLYLYITHVGHKKGQFFLKIPEKYPEKLIFGNNVNHFTTDDDQNTITYGILIPYIEFIISISICKKHLKT